MTLPPAMIRSRAQLATAYAPGAFFTFEGGRGACISLPMRADEADLPEITKAMIFEQIREFVQVWAERASARDPANGGPGPDVPMRLVLDRSLLGASDQVEVGRQDITFVTPNQIGYMPQPLSFACRRCGLIKTCDRPEKFDEFVKKRQIGCPEMAVKRPCADDWEQVDVIFVHWSGGWDPISPAERRLTSDNRIVLDQICRFCGHEHFRLIRAGQQFSQWYFECANGACRGRRELRQQDYDTLSLLGQSVITGGGHLRGEINMEPISYRASPTHYVHGDRLLVFSDSSLFDLLQGARHNDLVRFLAQQFGYPLRDMDDAEREWLLRQAGREQEWTDYVAMRGLIERLSQDDPARPAIEKQLQGIVRRWESEVFQAQPSVSPPLLQQVARRETFVQRYDPIRLTVEHETLIRERLRPVGTGRDGRNISTRIDEPDEHLTPSNWSGADIDAMRHRVRLALDFLGIETMRFIREFDVCEYSFAFTRTEALPTTRKHNMEMPVRLNLFPKIGANGQDRKHPIYAIKQSNEAFYVQLSERHLRAWLAANGMPCNGIRGMHLGGSLIENYDPVRFTRFIDAYRREGVTPRDPYAYVFGLLHTLAHQMIQVMAASSGLEQGSFGEHLFVPNLGFVVYRRGITMDLGNLSAMWREGASTEHGNAVLHALLQPSIMRCGSGSLCTKRGGACPDCAMIPETSCLTRNELLSRSFLAGGGVPHWDQHRTALVGYYDVVRCSATPAAA